MNDRLTAFLVAGLLVASPSAFAQESEIDPWEGFNRTVFEFNDGLDKYALKPITQGYKAVTPDPVEKGVTNFFGNISDIGSFFNNLLQGKIESAGEDIARVAFNTTFGFAGVLDVATAAGIEKHDEDFGQTLGYWGVESGPYLVLPFFGPSNVRDTGGLVVDVATSPISNIEDDSARYAVTALQVIDTRAQLLEAEKLVTGDRYSFIRDAYLQSREFKVNDGQVEDYGDENF
ncbi:VacJ family lipoprotein [Pontibacterium granulatum]|uniref:MlaA family lipoprotein n=1 Tax=Pontibacterium granulatum TaxID=2036029 RepID=UPI00249CA85A|nr:VacJ family lipoprotein [Pontibacterium granulatum]MDI3324432.1 VacJ family lipoprotein [Pontibacterium granulatum]